ncbi:hypothetical protein G7Y89_g9743 [Cudoniella acicularis]|uniref:Uncharacterized protein n=1 Tax=Cudoniella acicularis TaxID=354080 RepID=A0A8H4VZU4_9HELO|nr:hypothetical protein G7Y89_g9743 [Cudoniella acicularis]
MQQHLVFWVCAGISMGLPFGNLKDSASFVYACAHTQFCVAYFGLGKPLRCPGGAVLPNSAPDPFTPNHWNFFTLFFFPTVGAATASTAVLATKNKLPKCMMKYQQLIVSIAAQKQKGSSNFNEFERNSREIKREREIKPRGEDEELLEVKDGAVARGAVVKDEK